MGKQPGDLTRRDCLDFIERQQDVGRSHSLINRRLAAISALLYELNLFDPSHSPQNFVQPLRRGGKSDRRLNLYRKRPQRIPNMVSEDKLRASYEAMLTWRNRALVMLRWISCLRIAETVAIRFQDIECSRPTVEIPEGKGNQRRTAYMDRLTFAALNGYPLSQLSDNRGSALTLQEALGTLSTVERIERFPSCPR